MTTALSVSLKTITITDDSLTEKPVLQLPPKKSPPITALELAFFLMGGVACFGMNYCMASMVHYWQEVYGQTGYIMQAFCNNFGGFCAFLFYKRFFSHLKLSLVMTVAPILNFLLVVSIVFVGKYLPGTETPIKLFLNGLLNFLLGVFMFIIRYTQFKMVLRRGATQVAAFNAGMPIAGIFNTGLGMIMLFFVDNSNQYLQALYYIGFQVLCLMIILAATWAFFAKNSEEDFFGDGNVSVATAASTPSLTRPPPTLWATTKLVYPMLMTTFWGWCVSLMIMPNMLWAMGLGWENKNFETLLELMVYVISDFFGRITYGKLVLKNTMGCHSIMLFRTTFVAIPLYAYSGLVYGDDLLDKLYITFPYIILHGLFTGYLGSALMHVSGRRVVKRHKDNVAYLITLTSLAGQLYGSLVNLLALKLELN